jgi:ubiquinone/menaquinone biosynthesis C-methylase UbiE
MAKTKPFDEHASEYEQWFDDNYYVFRSELEAIRRVLPTGEKGMEIGIGSGIFAVPLGIKEGVEPSQPMRKKANERGIYPVDGVAEELPFADKSYDYALMVTTICFVDDIKKAFEEARRILKENGNLIIGFVDKNSPVGKSYIKNKNKSLFYKDAVFYSTEEVYRYLWETDFAIEKTYQTVFGMLDEITKKQECLSGYGKGSFVVIKARKS